MPSENLAESTWNVEEPEIYDILGVRPSGAQGDKIAQVGTQLGLTINTALPE